ncbi:hypothetical protein D918_10074 [Trichuris suis]|nr:hypothetical protein D918_10074 [Trichuris suis]
MSETRIEDANQALSMEERLGQVPTPSVVECEAEHDSDDSLQNVLTKRLINAMLLKQDSLVTMLLTTPGIDDIKRVAESIPKAAILPFISLLAVRLRSDDVPRLQLLLWLKHVLAAHTDFFAANPNHIAEVADIFPFLNSDLPSLESVLKLVGRFQLLTEFGNPAETSEREASSNNSDKRQVTSSAETTNDLLSTTNLWSELREPELWNRLEATEVYGYTDEDEPVEQESEREHEKKNSRRRDADVREKIHKRKRRIHSDA